ncbi:Avirulence (Avh) protein [Phytophthora megakarya]|uniref:Avirulence (Avh) protein n=1 Tax=Phytophthora megakarya TaxID=4795 RepID=A0A225UQP1_9STRA|nr:Avirulence (Avh) protein [Phytophthora megakarya]
MFSAILSYLKKIKRFFQSRENVELQSWLKARLSTDDVFKILQLDEAGDKLLSNPNLKRWAAFVEKKIGNPPELMMVMKLRTHYDDATLARMFEFGTKTKGTRKMAKKLQDAQFVRWFLDGKWPNEIIDDVFKVPLGASWTKTDDVQPIWAKYSKYFEKYKPNWRDLQ